MNTYLSSAQLKENAREKLTGHYGLFIGSSFLVGFLSLGITFLVSLLVPSLSEVPASFPELLLSEASAFLVSVFMGVFTAGITLMYMKVSCGSPATVSDIFYGFSHIQTALGISLAINAISTVPSLLYSIFEWMYQFTQDELFLYIAFPALAVGLVLTVPVALALSQSYYLMMDFPDKSAREILALSIRITKGHRFRLFYIYVSFIPLFLLGILSLVGLLWVAPYANMTVAQYYFDLMRTPE